MLELLGRSDVFREMSGRAELADVMKSVVSGAVALTQEQIRQRGETERARLQGDQTAGTGARPGGATGGSAGASAPSSRAPGSSPVREREQSYRLAHAAVDRAVRDGGATPAEGQEQHRRLSDAQVEQTIANPTASAAEKSGPASPASSPATSTTASPPDAWIVDNFDLRVAATPLETSAGA